MGVEINGKKYRELRCDHCRKLICFEYIFAGRIAFVCPRCGETSTFNFKHLPTDDTRATIEQEFTIKNSEIKQGEEVNK